MRPAIAILFLFASNCLAQVVPEARRVDWTPGVTIGVRGGIPTVGSLTQWTNFVTQAGADNTGANDVSVLLTSLCNICPSNQYIYVPAGKYKLTNTVGLYPLTTLNPNSNGWAIVGEGTNTVFLPTNSHAEQVGFISIDNNNFGAPFRLHGTHAKGVTNLTTAGEDMSSHIRKTIRISRSEAVTDPDIIVQDINFTDRVLSQFAIVETVSNGTNFTIDRPLMWEFHTNYDPWIEVNSARADRVGFHNFTVEGGTRSAFSIFGNRFFWLDRVKCVQGTAYFINAAQNIGLEVRNCYTFSTNSGAGSAMMLFARDTGNWIENVYASGGSPVIECNGTVFSAFSYIYTTNCANDPNIGAGAFVGYPFNSHGAHAMMNIWEGNHGTTFQVPDAYYGSASHQVAFRNHFHSYDPIREYLPRAVDINRWGTYISLVGNKLGSLLHVPTTFYNMTNDAYDGSASGTPTIYTIGYVSPGSRDYRTQDGFPHWKYPGPHNRVGPCTNTAAIPTNRIAGTFTNVTAGDVIILQATGAGTITNFYYPLNTNFPILTVSSVQAAYLEISKNIVSTNNDVVYKIGDGSFFKAFHYHHQIDTLLFHGNTDASNGFNKILWDASGTVSDSNLPPSLITGRTTTPSWFTNKTYGTNITWPPVNPTNGMISDWAARSYWEDPDFIVPGSIRSRHGQGKGAKPKR